MQSVYHWVGGFRVLFSKGYFVIICTVQFVWQIGFDGICNCCCTSFSFLMHVSLFCSFYVMFYSCSDTVLTTCVTVLRGLAFCIHSWWYCGLPEFDIAATAYFDQSVVMVLIYFQDEFGHTRRCSDRYFKSSVLVWVWSDNLYAQCIRYFVVPRT